MINNLIKLFLIPLMLSCNLTFAKNKISSFTAKVVGIYDGDTIKVISEVNCNNTYKKNKKFKCKNEKKITQYKIRLFGIDAPEMGQAFGKQSKKMLSDLIFNKTILIEPTGIDIYKRLIANIYLNNVWINSKMIELGRAWAYRQYLNDDFLVNIEKAARAKKIGIWSLDKQEQIPPWSWRKNNKNFLKINKSNI